MLCVCVFFFVSVYTRTYRNNARISNFEGGSRFVIESSWCIRERRENQKKIKEKQEFLRKTSFRLNRFFYMIVIQKLITCYLFTFLIIAKNWLLCSYSIKQTMKKKKDSEIKPCKKNANHNNRYKHKKFYDFSTSKLLANFRVFDRFQQLISNLVLNFQFFLVIQNFFIDTSKKNSHKNRKFLWSINNSKKVKFFENLTILIYKKTTNKYRNTILNEIKVCCKIENMSKRCKFTCKNSIAKKIDNINVME
ncbi:Uncharacterized protein FWK35_00004719, partial [Aphis craccivora]